MLKSLPFPFKGKSEVVVYTLALKFRLFEYRSPQRVFTSKAGNRLFSQNKRFFLHACACPLQRVLPALTFDGHAES